MVLYLVTPFVQLTIKGLMIVTIVFKCRFQHFICDTMLIQAFSHHFSASFPKVDDALLRNHPFVMQHFPIWYYVTVALDVINRKTSCFHGIYILQYLVSWIGWISYSRFTSYHYHCKSLLEKIYGKDSPTPAFSFPVPPIHRALSVLLLQAMQGN